MIHKLCGGLFFVLLALPLRAQDLFERARSESKGPVTATAAYQGRERLDLQLSADLRSASLKEDRNSAKVGVDSTFDFDFACGRFDVGANLRSLFTRNAREEFLGAVMGRLESEFAKNALVLACEASPTLCQALQHYRISANAMLGMNYDRCRAVEEGVQGSLEKQRAEAIKACVEEKRRAGVPLDRALDECESPDKVRSVTGERVHEVDLVGELKKGLNLSPDEREGLETFVGDQVKYNARGGKGQIARDAIEQEYKTLREGYEKKWQGALDAFASGQKLAPETAATLLPPGSPPVSPGELAELSVMRPSLRRVLVASIASQCALLELVRRVHEVERNLEAARKLPGATDEFVRKLDRERADLRSEIGRLVETHERQGDLNRTLLDVARVARGNVDAGSLSAIGQLVLDERRSKVAEDTQKWGGGTPLSKSGNTPSANAGCAGCDSATWGFGSLGEKK